MKSTSLFLSTAVLFSAVFANADSNADSDALLTGTYSDGKLYWVLKDYIGMEDGYFAAKLGSVGDYVWEQEGAKVYIGDDQMDPSEYQLTVTGHVNQLVVPNVPTECELTYDFAPADVTGSGPWALTMIATHSISEGKTRVLQVSYTVPNPKTTTKPASTISPSQSNTAPVVTSTNPAVASTNPAVASTNPAVASTNSNTPTTTSSVSSNPEGSTTNNNVAPGNNVATNNNVATDNTVATDNNAATGDNVATTVITITSCADHICTKKPVTTGVTVCTATENGVETVYTTYCPLSGATSATPAPVTTPAATTPVTAPATTLASVSQSQTYTPPAVATATGIAAAVEVKGAAFGAALIALVALM